MFSFSLSYLAKITKKDIMLILHSNTATVRFSNVKIGDSLKFYKFSNDDESTYTIYMNNWNKMYLL
jgi:hypothetical protein